MVWISPPVSVEVFRDMILACPAATAISLTVDSCHYPSAAIDPDAGSADTMPLAVFASETERSEPYAAGAGGLFGGTVSSAFHFSAGTSTVGGVESFCRNLVRQLSSLTTGLPLRSISTTVASDPTGGGRTQTAYIVGVVTAEWGLSS